MTENFRVPSLPSSFVTASMKISKDAGSGESKLFIGPMSSESKLDNFFEFNSGYKYFIDRTNLLEYLLQVKLEYIYHKFNDYKNADINVWQNNFDTVSKLSTRPIYIDLKKFADKDRYYVRSEDTEFKKILRSLALPKITDIVFIKDSAQQTIQISLELNLSYDKSNILDDTVVKDIKYQTGLQSIFSRNRIIFGAPGTGKSYSLNKDRKDILDENNITDYERVTFYLDYSYANFVGTYKPVMVEREIDDTSDTSSDIAYKYVPGPFMRMYVKALKNAQTDNPRPFLLIIEEINRANVAAVFGDIFQLLDRGDDNVSEYPIQASEDMKNYLSKELGGNPENYSQIRIPDNLFIWATMNSADQGVFPMDTAFKRRWDFTYLGINDNDGEIANLSVEINGKTIYWNALRKAINDYLAKIGINEDKQLGPFFLKKDVIGDGKKFCEVFKHKIIMYLFEDAAKQKRASVFSGLEREKLRYSKICEEFDKRGIEIFDKEIQKNYADYTAYDDAVNNYNTQMQNDEES